MKATKILSIALVAAAAACGKQEPAAPLGGALEIRAISATILGQEPLTRADAAAKAKIGRSTFAAGETLVFTTIRRTQAPLDDFSYSDIHYAFDGSTWERSNNTPEKIYWTDGSSAHTFIGYSLPAAGYHWEVVHNNGGMDTYAGELCHGKTEIDYTSGNDALMAEDLLVNYDTATRAESDGLSTKVKFTHALSNVCVVVNIQDYAASASAVDTQVEVRDMVIYDQPARFTWGADSKSLTVVNFSEQGTGHIKNLRLWCPVPGGEGTGQSKTFTFYGLTTPQDAAFRSINGNNRPLSFSFTVTYPNPMNPDGPRVVKTYHGSFADVSFFSGRQTTLNISLNHRGEQMYTDVTYSDWNFVATPDIGELRKKSTFLDINSSVTIHTDPEADEYDATWLYGSGNSIMDIYGNDGSQSHPYRICTASQLLSFAKEVNGGLLFDHKYVRLDADITMQESTAKTSAEDETSGILPVSWTGIGNGTYAFNGTFLGGDRYINRLYGSPLFASLGSGARIEQLQITSIGSISGGGALAGSSEGAIAACKVIDDVTTTGGALVGTNSGVIYACYHTGDTYGTAGLVGTNTGSIIGCYQAGDVIGGTAFSIALTSSGTILCPSASTLYEMQQESFVTALNEELDAWYAHNTSYPRYHFLHSAANYPIIVQ